MNEKGKTIDTAKFGHFANFELFEDFSWLDGW